MCRIKIDTSEETVSLGDSGTSRVLHRQWVTFYLALALRVLARDQSSPFLEAHELRLFGSWFLKKPESVGKEVARHLQDLSEWGMADLISHDGRTKRWRLGVPSEEIALRPSRERCDSWLRQQQWDILGGIEVIPRTILDWLSCTTKAVIRLEQGRIEEGLSLIQAAKTSCVDSVLLGAVAEIVELRLYARRGEYPDIEDCKYLSQCDGKIGSTLLLRANLAQALAPDFENLDLAIENIRGLTLRSEALPDINGLGNTYNALGVLFRRAGQFELAQKCLRYAVTLLIASFDLPTLQAALFNLGHTLYKQAADDAHLREALHLIELDREICATFGLGRNSAQGEVVAGIICLQLGDFSAAERWLEAGRELVATLDSDYNKAEVERLHARILWVRSWKEKPGIPKNKDAILAKLREALDLTARAGFPSSDIEQEIALVRRGERPKWVT
jgi:tetratricopeptide (TPR) repeat protein